MPNFDDIKFLSNPANWPGQEERREKVCCVKKLPRNMNSGYSKYGVVLSIVGEAPTTVLVREGASDTFSGKEEYESVEEMVADGWIVD